VKKETGINFSEIVNDFLSLNIHESELSKRSPVVSIMGHIDHGKTTLLDTIRKTNLQIKEEGGITQKVSVSEVEFQGEKITFLDTPGHSDFIKMRERGISLTDIVVLVIDAKDGVMSQTEEIIKYINRYKLSVIVFINHKRGEETDNENNINRIRTQLQEKELNPIE
jgi:translation initiation factor IF-2